MDDGGCLRQKPTFLLPSTHLTNPIPSFYNIFDKGGILAPWTLLPIQNHGKVHFLVVVQCMAGSIRCKPNSMLFHTCINFLVVLLMAFNHSVPSEFCSRRRSQNAVFKLHEPFLWKLECCCVALSEFSRVLGFRSALMEHFDFSDLVCLVRRDFISC